MKSIKPVVIVRDPDPTRRLAWVSALSARYEVSAPGDEEPLRLIRRVRPALVLLTVAEGRPGEASALCRAIKTEAGSPPRVGLLDPGGRLTEPAAAAQACLADGLLGGTPPDLDARLRFVADTLAGAKPVTLFPVEGGLLRRLRGLWTG